MSDVTEPVSRFSKRLIVLIVCFTLFFRYILVFRECKISITTSISIAILLALYVLLIENCVRRKEVIRRDYLSWTIVHIGFTKTSIIILVYAFLSILLMVVRAPSFIETEAVYLQEHSEDFAVGFRYLTLIVPTIFVNINAWLSMLVMLIFSQMNYKPKPCRNNSLDCNCSQCKPRFPI